MEDAQNVQNYFITTKFDSLYFVISNDTSDQSMESFRFLEYTMPERKK